MKIVTAAEMREIDRRTTEEFGVPSLTLMENAGAAVAEFCLREYPKAQTVGVICGKGNNGGDGFVAARKLHEAGKTVRVLLLADAAEVKGDAGEMLKRLPIEPVIARNEAEFGSEPVGQILQSDLVLDAILGTGFKPPVSGLYEQAIEILHDVRGIVVSVDIPSGLDADRMDLHGEFGPVVTPDAVVTFTAPKPFVVFPVPIVVAQIGSPAELAGKVARSTKLNLAVPGRVDHSCRSFVRTDEPVMLMGRRADANKGDFGHVLVIGGSRGKAGAAAMAGIAALRAGAGLCTVATAHSVLSLVSNFAPELMTEALVETEAGTISKRALQSDLSGKILKGKAVLAIGPGVSRHSETAEFVRDLVRSTTTPIVLDADGLNAFEGCTDLLDGSDRTLVLTPHPGEMARLAGTSTDKVQRERLGIARDFAREHHCVVVLKGNRTVIAEQNGEAWINPTGNAGMAKGGSGDVLTGMVAGLLAQVNTADPHQLDASEEERRQIAAVGDHFRLYAVITAVYLHGLAGDIAAGEQGMRSMLAGDIIAHIGTAMRELNSIRQDQFTWIGRLDRVLPSIE